MPSKFPPKGWCWHRDAKLAMAVNEKQEVLAVWKCPACQNMTQLLKPAEPA